MGRRFTTQAGVCVKLVGEYVDEGISGDKAEKRPGFQRLLADAKNGVFEGITCYDQSRLGRMDEIDFGHWMAPVRAAGVRLFFTNSGEGQWHDVPGPERRP